MSGMLEKVARAMFDAELAGVPAEIAEASWRLEGHRERWMDRARAAIEAMREPTKDLKIAGLQELPFGPSSPALVTSVWQAMIDAALTPSGENA